MIRDHQFDFLVSLQKQVRNDYAEFWNSFLSRMNVNTYSMDKTSQAIAKMQGLNSFTQAAFSPPLPNIVSQVNSQIESLLSGFKASANLANTLSDFSGSLESSINYLSNLSPSVSDSVEDIRKSVGCSAYFLDVIEKNRNWNLTSALSADYSARLFKIGQAHSDFVNRSLGLLQQEFTSVTYGKILRSLDVATDQLLISSDALSSLIPSVESITQLPPPCTLNLPVVQQREILEMDSESESPVPSTVLSYQTYTDIHALLQCNDATTTAEGQALISLTCKVVVAVNELPWVVAEDDTTFGKFIDHLYFLFYEGAGTDKLRYLIDYGGVLAEEDCSFLWRLKHIRNLWLRHDIERGSESEKKRKRLELKTDLAFYGFDRKPLSTDEFRTLQATVVKDMGAFVSTLESAILKS